jgi:hypothetical protein
MVPRSAGIESIQCHSHLMATETHKDESLRKCQVKHKPSLIAQSIKISLLIVPRILTLLKQYQL